MADDPESGKPEIVIVRRRSTDDGAAGKAGAWKIAYADFVTAMMAFFLVMWLINASNEETRSQVASYFNPIKLTDSSTGARSIKDMKDTRNPESTQAGETAEGTPPAKKDVKEESEMLANPPRSLDRIAKTISESEYRNAGLESTVEIAPSLKPDQSNPGVGDPFDPRSWNKISSSANGEQGVSEETAEDAKIPSPERERTRSPTAAAEQEALDLASDIANQLRDMLPKHSGDIEVSATKSGLLVSLTESAAFEMFKTGSAEPEPQMMQLVEAVARALKTRDGDIIIRGHTDSRPYRNKYYDNWQLSTARANFARYMLIRGGIGERRIRRVEGVADLEPKNPDDPQAPENRRIEIFITDEVP